MIDLSPTLTAEIADAIAELEAYDDDEHVALLHFVRSVLDPDSSRETI